MGQLGGSYYNELPVRTFSDSGTKYAYVIAEDANGHQYYQYVVENSYYGSGVYKLADPIVYDGTEVATLEDGTKIYVDGNVYYSENADGTYTRYEYKMCIAEYYNTVVANVETAFDVSYGATAAAGDSTFKEQVENRINRDENTDDDDDDDTESEGASKYITENIVAVTYGNDDGSAYKTVILNYNDYYVSVVYDGVEYTIPAYEFVEIPY